MAVAGGFLNFAIEVTDELFNKRPAFFLPLKNGK